MSDASSVPALARSPTLAHRLEYTAFVSASAVLRTLPRRTAESVGATLGRLGFAPFRIRRGVVEANLRTAFPHADPAWIHATARAAYAHLGRETVATLRAARDPAQALVDRATVDGLERLHHALEAGHGAVVLSAHFGNWELGAATLAALGLPVDILVQRQRNPLFDRAIIDARRRLGVHVIDRGLATRTGLRTLRDNRLLMLAPDQNAGRSGVFVPFFGKLASTTRGPIVMAMRAQAPILMETARRESDGSLRVTVRELARRVERSDHAVTALIRTYVEALETVIREAPEQYFWHHRRWKTRPAEEPQPQEQVR